MSLSRDPSQQRKNLEPGQFVWVVLSRKLTWSMPGGQGIFPTTLEKVVGRGAKDNHDIEYVLVGPDGAERTIYSYFLEPLNALELLSEIPETMFQVGKNVLDEGSLAKIRSARAGELRRLEMDLEAARALGKGRVPDSGQEDPPQSS